MPPEAVWMVVDNGWLEKPAMEPVADCWMGLALAVLSRQSRRPQHM